LSAALRSPGQPKPEFQVTRVGSDKMKEKAVVELIPYKENNYILVSSTHKRVIVQELCESRGGRPGLSVLTSLLVSVDVKIYCTVLRHWSQLVPNMSHDI